MNLVFPGRSRYPTAIGFSPCIVAVNDRVLFRVDSAEQFLKAPPLEGTPVYWTVLNDSEIGIWPIPDAPGRLAVGYYPLQAL